MCGFVGFRASAGRFDEHGATVERMAAALAHRGPDDSGVWLDAEAGVALGHRRLSVIDLSAHGHQPMLSHCDRFVLVFNGEIYNHRNLRRELEAQGSVSSWHGRSDTEVLLEAIASWGVDRALRRAVGMFAFSLWDRKRQELTLARDRIGEKPLYYGWSKGTLLFASELKALRRHPDWDGQIDRGALSLFLRHGYVPSPCSIYQNVRKVPPGTALTFATDTAPNTWPEARTYWSLARFFEAPRSRLRDDAARAVDELEQRLVEAIRMQMLADVPVGAFLSGGIDSSTVVALMQELSTRPVRTFTIGFREQQFDEALHAREVAKMLGTEHTELYVTPQDAMEVVPRLPEIYDEPFADSSQIPTFLVSRLARSQVTVSLSGDGGDELFAGYPRYALAEKLWRIFGWAPSSLRSTVARGLKAISPHTWGVLSPVLEHLPLDERTRKFPGDRVQALAEVIESKTPPQLYHRLCSHWKSPQQIVIDAQRATSPYDDPSRWVDTRDFLVHMTHVDAVAYLPDDILVKLDRAAMAVSLETRIPLLDHRVVEFAASLPRDLKVRHGTTKWILRQVLHRRLPAELFNRPKSGFAIPVGAWLRGPFRDWAESLLSARLLRDQGYFDPTPIRAMWDDHLSGTRSWHAYLWDILMFQAWLEHQGRE